MTTESRAEDEVDAPRVGIHAREIGGLPHVFTSMLTIMRVSEDTAYHFLPESGIYAGVICHDDTIITFNPVVVPRMNFSRVVLAVEFTSYDHEIPPPTCSLKVVYLGRDGKTRGLVTHLLPADGGVARVEIPADHVRVETVLATAAKIVLMDEAGGDTTVDVPSSVRGSGKRPILVRGAWLEFPFSQ